MSENAFKKRRDGIVINITDYKKYLQERNNIKILAKTKQELKTNKNELSIIKTELEEVKELLQQILKAKNN